MKKRLFRGKDRTGILNKDWLYGMLDSLDEDFPRIIYKDRWGNRIIADVDKESVGQFTGLTDKNIKDIFEGDILTGLFLHSMPVTEGVAKGGDTGNNKTYVVVCAFEEELSRFFVKMTTGEFKPTKQRCTAHGAHNNAVFDFHVTDLPRCK